MSAFQVNVGVRLQATNQTPPSRSQILTWMTPRMAAARGLTVWNRCTSSFTTQFFNGQGTGFCLGKTTPDPALDTLGTLGIAAS